MMKKFKVYGNYTVTITKEVWANDEDEAITKAEEKFGGIMSYVGNGSMDKLIGVSSDDESIEADGMAEWNEAEELEDDPDYFECPDCGEECERRTDTDDTEYWFCEECCTAFDDEGNEIYPEAEDIEDED